MRSKLLAAVAMTALVLPGAAPAATEMANGTSVTISGALNSEQDYFLTVPASDNPYPYWVTFITSGGTGDPDLIVSYGPYTPGNADCVSESAGTAEDCDVYEPAPGAWYVKVFGYTAYSNVTLTARYFTALPIQNGVPLAGLSATTGASKLYYLDVPQGADVSGTLSEGTGNADLVLSHVLAPTTLSVSCLSDGPTNSESCETRSLSASRWYFGVRATTDYAGAQLLAEYSSPSASGGALGPPSLGGLLLAGLLAMRRRSIRRTS